MAKFEIVIENGQRLSFMELREIIGIIDDHIALEIGRRTIRRGRVRIIPPYYFDDEIYADQPDYSFVEIESVREGSIILDVVVGGAATWALAAIALGLRRSRLGEQLTKLGKGSGDLLADGLDVLNARLKEWTDVNARIRDRKTQVKIKKIPKEEDPKQLPPPDDDAGRF